jgi:uncharacterized damage-inducible protein DinB
MKIADLLLAQMEREARGSRESLERFPAGRTEWRPHPKSMPFGTLATLVATMPSWVATIVDEDELDLSVGAAPTPPQSSHELIALHDQSLGAAREALSNTSDEHLMTSWRLRFGDRILDERPRHLIIADTISHLAHHRGQLTVYLRLNDQPVPEIYGPSADSSW